MEQTESPEIHPGKRPLVLMNMQRPFSGEGTVFSTNGAGATGHLYTKKLTYNLLLCTELTSNWIDQLLFKTPTCTVDGELNIQTVPK